MSNLSRQERDKLGTEHFAGPGRSYPIMDQQDVQSAWDTAHQSGNPDHTRAGILAMCQKKKLDLPRQSYQPHDGGMATYSSGAAVESLTYVTDQALFSKDAAPGWVRRTGKIFEIGDFPEHRFSLTEEEADKAIANFTPVYGDLEHKNTVLDGKVGVMQKIWREGKAIFGAADVPEWLHQSLDDTTSYISCAWDRATKTLQGWGWALDPAIEDAALFSAQATFSARQAALLSAMPAVSANNGVVNTLDGPGQSHAHFNSRKAKERKFMPLIEQIRKKLEGKSAAEAAPGTTANFSGGTQQLIAQVPVDNLLAALQANPEVIANLQASQPAIAQALAALQGKPATTTTTTPAATGLGAAAFSAPGADVEPMDEGTAEFKAQQIVNRATELADRYIADGKKHTYKREALIAAFTAAGYDNEQNGPSLVTFTRADNTQINDRVQMLIEVLDDGPAHSLFSKTMPISVYNGAAAPDQTKSAAEQGKEQADAYNASLGAQIGAAIAGAAK